MKCSGAVKKKKIKRVPKIPNEKILSIEKEDYINNNSEL